MLLAVATVAAAWCAFQATKWGGVQANSFSAAGATRTESTRASTEAGQQQIVDVTLFTQWLAAAAADDQRLRGFYEERFRDEFQPAFDEWLDSEPLQNPKAAQSPFALDSYVLAAQTEAEALQGEADSLSQTARQANSQGDQYVLTTVLFASVLFFAGIAMKIGTRWVQAALLGIGVILFLGTILTVSTMPIEF